LNVNDRNPWLAGIFTFFTIGLGHLYIGHAKKAIFLFFVGQTTLLAITLSLIYLYPTLLSIFIIIFVVFAFFLYCIVDAVKLSKNKKYGYTLKKYNKWYVYFGCWILASFVVQPIVSSSIKVLFIQAYKIPATSLEPTILQGDHILAKKLLNVRQGIGRGDMVIFPYPNDTSTDYIKRIIATGGDTVEIVNKEVFVNGNKLNESYVIYSDPEIIPKSYSPRDNLGPIAVPDNAIFVMGDNRDHSNDSRFWGFVERDAVKGKAYTIYWSWDSKNFKVRWNRIGKKIL